MVFVDLDLARRLEGLETWWASEFAEIRQEIRPEADTARVSVAGGYACYLGEGAPINEAKGMGMAGPVSVEDFETMERVFFDRGVTAKVMVCPLADPSLLQGLASRGYRPIEFEDVLFRVLDPAETFAGVPEGIELEWVNSDDSAICGETLARGFVAPEEPNAAMLELFEISSRIEGVVGLLARVDGEPAGAASLLIRAGLAMLGGASTLPIYRNRGIQTALAHARLARASKLGCDLAVVGALPGSTSHRNAERLGFRVAYTKLALVRSA
jgi:GNAT superfamily N-acetyltransferase